MESVDERSQLPPWTAELPTRPELQRSTAGYENAKAPKQRSAKSHTAAHFHLCDHVRFKATRILPAAAESKYSRCPFKRKRTIVEVLK